jgi:hypothetical protein
MLQASYQDAEPEAGKTESRVKRCGRNGCTFSHLEGKDLLIELL